MQFALLLTVGLFTMLWSIKYFHDQKLLNQAMIVHEMLLEVGYNLMNYCCMWPRTQGACSALRACVRSLCAGTSRQDSQQLMQGNLR